MSRLAWPALLCALAACGATDDRPLDAQYLTDTIFAPACGSVECHSTFVQSNNAVFDTYSAMRSTIVNFPGPLVSFSPDQYDPADPKDSFLVRLLTQIDAAPGIDRMPLDAPMPNADVELIKAWITGPVDRTDDDATCTPGVTACPQLADTCVVPDGGTVGECFLIKFPHPAMGAECDPSQFNGLACNGLDLVKCDRDWNFSDLVQTCTTDCIGGKCT
jgi:hypothetical protein